LQSQRELEATREKLRLLEKQYDADKGQQEGDAHIRELSMRSLKRLITQLKEEIAQFEAHNSRANAALRLFTTPHLPLQSAH
jgi:hypothetical protein